MNHLVCQVRTALPSLAEWIKELYLFVANDGRRFTQRGVDPFHSGRFVRGFSVVLLVAHASHAFNKSVARFPLFGVPQEGEGGSMAQ